ncbi:MAG: hypothetical protein IJM17_09090 [Firmicutes bacterium]|nr:hypothetical protein [Bacillota bacterium]
METINITVCYDADENEISTQTDIILGDLLRQLGERRMVPAGQNLLVMKNKSEDALDQAKTLAENGIRDKDVLHVATAAKAG